MNYKNKILLRKQYIDKKLSTPQIAKMCNCSNATIWNWLRKHKIPIRSCKEGILLSNKIKRKDKQYCNKDWLEQKYLIEKLSTIQISKLIKVNDETIRKWLWKFNISVRSRDEGIHLAKANHCNLSQEAKEWIDGELLGDGCLYSQSKYSAKFQYSSKYLEYIQYVSDTLKSFGIQQSGKIRKNYSGYAHNEAYCYSSLNYPELLSIRKRWYPKGKKIIPKDLELTPLLLRQEHIGDGCLKHPKNGNPYIQLATCGFLINDVEWLILQLNKLGFKSTRQPNNNTIYISTYSTKDFLDYIGKCPVKCYNYKFNY